MSNIHVSLNHKDAPTDAVVLSLRIIETISEPFDIVLKFGTHDPDLDIGTWLWSTASIEISGGDTGDEPRFFHGVVERASFVGFFDAPSESDVRFASFELRLRPHIHGLAYRVRSRIFQNQTVNELVDTTLTDSGVPPDSWEWKTQVTYPPQEYRVQWRESELDHVMRRLECDGIFFFFEHDAVGHTMVLVDQPFAPDPINGNAILEAQPRSANRTTDTPDAVFDAALRTRITHDAAQSRDWDFQLPEAPRQAEARADARFPRYEFPGGYSEQSEGGRLAQVRLDEELGKRYELVGTSTSRNLAPGRFLTLAGGVPNVLDNDYMVEHAEHTYSHERISHADDPGQFLTRFRARVVGEPYSPPRRTPVPEITGLESAVVTGPAGEEIHVDEMGRIKVHFYWDRENPVDDTASCWLRVQQMNTSGSMILPRIGWEVFVAFLNGDPDRPLALLKAYNRETLPPYELPANMTQSALQSSTTPGGGSVNEIRLQDGNGGMDWAMNASKDLNVKALNNSSETIGVDSNESVGAVSSVSVGASDTVSIGANQAVSVKAVGGVETAGGKSVSVGATDDWGTTGSFSVTVGGSRDETIGGLMNVVCNSGAESIKGSHDRTVGAVQAYVAASAIAETVGGSKTETVSAAKVEVLGTNHEETIKGLKTLNSGLVKITAGKDVTTAAKGAVTINSAGSIKIDAGSDVTVNGTVVTVIGAGGVSVKGAGGKLDLKGSTVTVDASAFGGKGGPTLQIKGPIDYNT